MLLKYISIPLMFLSFLQQWIGQISSAKTSPVNLRPEHARRCTRIRTRMRTHVRTRMHMQASGCAHDSNIKNGKMNLSKDGLNIYTHTHTHTHTHTDTHTHTFYSLPDLEIFVDFLRIDLGQCDSVPDSNAIRSWISDFRFRFIKITETSTEIKVRNF